MAKIVGGEALTATRGWRRLPEGTTLMIHGAKALVETLIEAGHRLDTLGYVPARDGNLSARLGPDRILVTATNVRKRALTAGSFVTVDLSGRVQGTGRASTELGMHLAIYRRRPEVAAIVHAHPPVAVGFASAGLGLTDCLVPEIVVNLGSVPLTPYATPGTPELEAAIADTVAGHDAFLLANHGAVTVGASVDQALDRMETLEHFARVALVARLVGGARPLSRDDVTDLDAARRRSGATLPVTCEPALAPRDTPEDLAGLVAQVVREVLGPGR